MFNFKKNEKTENFQFNASDGNNAVCHLEYIRIL